MALNVKLQVYRGPLADLQTLASTGAVGVLAWTTDSNELYVDLGSGSPGVGPGNAWQRVAADNAVWSGQPHTNLSSFTNAKLGDFALANDNNLTYVLTTYPPTNNANWTAVAQSAPVAGYTDVQWLASATAHEWVTYIDSSGVQHLAQPAFSDISGSLAQTQLPASIGVGSSLTDIDLGTF